MGGQERWGSIVSAKAIGLAIEKELHGEHGYVSNFRHSTIVNN